MHEPAGVVENLVQILHNTPILNTPPPNENCQKSWHFNFSVSEYPPCENCQKSWHFNFSVSEYPPQMKIVRNLGTLTFQFQNTPPRENCQKSWHFNFSVSEYPPPTKNPNFQVFPTNPKFHNTPPKMKIVRNLGTLTFQFQNTPSQMKIVRNLGTLTFQFQNTPPRENCQKSWHFNFSVSESPPMYTQTYI